MVRYGRSGCPEGFLPVYSVGDEAEAKRLLTMACRKSYDGEYVAAELMHEQTLDNLAAFSDRLDVCHDRLIASGACRCKGRSPDA